MDHPRQTSLLVAFAKVYLPRENDSLPVCFRRHSIPHDKYNNWTPHRVQGIKNASGLGQMRCWMRQIRFDYKYKPVTIGVCVPRAIRNYRSYSGKICALAILGPPTRPDRKQITGFFSSFLAFRVTEKGRGRRRRKEEEGQGRRAWGGEGFRVMIRFVGLWTVVCHPMLRWLCRVGSP